MNIYTHYTYAYTPHTPYIYIYIWRNSRIMGDILMNIKGAVGAYSGRSNSQR